MINRVEKEVDMLHRHITVLEWVHKNEPIGILKISEETGYPHHKVRYSLRKLEEENLIVPTKTGAITTDNVNNFIGKFNEENSGLREKLIQLNSVAELEA